MKKKRKSWDTVTEFETLNERIEDTYIVDTLLNGRLDAKVSPLDGTARYYCIGKTTDTGPTRGSAEMRPTRWLVREKH